MKGSTNDLLTFLFSGLFLLKNHLNEQLNAIPLKAKTSPKFLSIVVGKGRPLGMNLLFCYERTQTNYNAIECRVLFQLYIQACVERVQN